MAIVFMTSLAIGVSNLTEMMLERKKGGISLISDIMTRYFSLVRCLKDLKEMM